MKYYYAARIEADGGATEIDGAQVVLAEEYARLREAIEKHRRNRWGDGPVKDSEDWWLYAALQEAGDEHMAGRTQARDVSKRP